MEVCGNSRSEKKHKVQIEVLLSTSIFKAQFKLLSF